MVTKRAVIGFLQMSDRYKTANFSKHIKTNKQTNKPPSKFWVKQFFNVQLETRMFLKNFF